MASSSLVAVAGSKFYIGGRVAAKGTVTATDFVGQTWTEVDGWTQAGTLGDTQELVSQNFINQGRTRQIKGTRVGGTMENTFVPLPGDKGQQKFNDAIEECTPRAFKIEWGAGCAIEDTVTISVAEPGIVTWADGHGLEEDAAVMFTGTGGTLPTGLEADTAYYVVAPITATSHAVALTAGGAAIETTGAGTATAITATAQPGGQTDMFYGLAMPGAKQGGEANTAILRTWSVAIDSNVLEV